MTITISTSNILPRDVLAATWLISQENERRAAENARRAALTPPQAALPLLPSGTAAEKKASYETVLIGIVTAAHASYMEQEAHANGPEKPEFRTAFATATPAQRNAALTALTT